MGWLLNSQRAERELLKFILDVQTPAQEPKGLSMVDDPNPSGAMASQPLLEELYNRWRQDPKSVDSTWRYFFDGMDFALQRPAAKELQAPSDLRIYHLIEAYRTYGHLIARFNPIDPSPITQVPQLRLDYLGFQESELALPFPTCGLLTQDEAPLSEIISALRDIYCAGMGIEYMGLQSPEMESWIQQQIEPSRGSPDLSIDRKKLLLQWLNQAELFELFLHTKYVGQKRFSLEGGETLIPILHTIMEEGAKEGMTNFVIGMAHRGRLNVLANILNKSYSNIFHEFEDTLVEASFEGTGDVKYHKGFSADVKTSTNRAVHISLPANPSHLESIDPVVEGQTRAKQVQRGDDKTMSQVIPILIHGDASVAGQGVVYETLQLCNLPGYGVGGTIHLVINNQIGFTTTPREARSTRYCTDIARAFSAPVFHVNAEDPEKCVQAAIMAIQLRHRFHCDVFIDLNCYRKYGHNESDEPAFTQPLEYKLIRGKQSVREVYRDALIQQGVVERQIAEQLETEFKQQLQTELDLVQSLKTEPTKDTATAEWKAIRQVNRTEDRFVKIPTEVSPAQLRQLTKLFTTPPEGFTVHRKIERHLEERLAMIEGDSKQKKINWGLGEYLAYASLLWEGVHVRLSGQDCRRGTFSHRHAMWVDQETGAKYFPLSRLKEGQGRFDVFNSPLSEFAVLGFEFGYSLSYHNALVVWEAQFGDFANGAQVIIDQYLATSEQKWDRMSGLVLLLPHGYEGQGPEHSSARIERFLQLAGHDNIRVVNPTTPAQIFHLLRRQMLRQSRKPLVIFTPKGLFGHPECVSSLDEFTSGQFQEILDDPNPPKKARRLLLCSGRVFYDLTAERTKRKADDIAIIRVEQLYPLHIELLRQIMSRYQGVEDVCWVQEEPENMGAWDHLKPQLSHLLHGRELLFIGRERSASPAAGSHKKHQSQKAAIMDTAFGRR